jgi:hypothetical protein
MSNLVIQEIKANSVAGLSTEYNNMLAHISESFPEITKASSNFFKSTSQFANFTIDVTAVTPIRSIYHILAEIERIKAAIQENFINAKKKDIELRQKKVQRETETDAFAIELLDVEILEIELSKDSLQNYMKGAIRKMNAFINQYQGLMKKIGKEELSEEDYELDEARYHIITCMKQGLNAARTRNGVIDEGNFIYLFELGINAAQAQAEVFAYLNMENELISNGMAPTHEMTVRWLEACADKWANDPAKFAEYRGLNLMDRTSLTNLPQITNVGET